MTTPTVRPLAASAFLDTCRSMANHVIVIDADRVVFCGTDRADAARYAALVPDDRLTVEHTTGPDSRERPPVDERPWNRETVREELDALCALHGAATFAERATLSAEDLYARLVSRDLLTASNRALVGAVLRAA